MKFLRNPSKLLLILLFYPDFPIIFTATHGKYLFFYELKYNRKLVDYFGRSPSPTLLSQLFFMQEEAKKSALNTFDSFIWVFKRFLLKNIQPKCLNFGLY